MKMLLLREIKSDSPEVMDVKRELGLFIQRSTGTRRAEMQQIIYVASQAWGSTHFCQSVP
jgi:hypothetical protein